MTKIVAGGNFPVSALYKLKNVKIRDNYILTDTPCEEVRRIVEEEADLDFRDTIISFTLVSTAVILSVVGTFWKTFTLVNNHLIPIGAVVFSISLALSVIIAYSKRRAFLNRLIKECDDE